MSEGSQISRKLQDEIIGLAESINHIIETFKKLQHPLAESTESVPKATEQLDKISKQTEQAAHKMLDKIEQITMRADKVITGLTKIPTLADGKHADELNALVKELSTNAEANRDDAYQIMDALQFQDITSQQMDHAASLLEETEGKLRLIGGILQGNESQANEENKGEPKRQRAFDPHAEFVDKQAHQKDIDSMFAHKK